MKAVFLDRDGTLGGDGYGTHPDKFEMFDFAPEAVKALNNEGVKVVLFTNQSRIGRGYFTEEELLEGFTRMKTELAAHSAYIDAIYYCPHHPKDDCDCRKPNIGLLEQAKQELQLDLEKSFVVGDTGGSDMLAASRAGTRMVLVKTGRGEGSLTKFKDHWPGIEPDHIAEDVLDAAMWIVQQLKKEK
ncbi:D-glycero-alpha-D-manno-heptose-1,7-bisphosphate 7-phosphatase [Planococcus halotolerans]|uniref:D,D-heptose 1,7-bisphosphate phosphatase n=1 Tax=Planococcus halotolerans TaxID=2233542 RepID=A0A365KUF1_9BACL|nr:HAD family hydrolase [Planococcus halotolerans]RAZ76768.1 hypothetical protein DP120_12115 [Planococcus halotolerans]